MSQAHANARALRVVPAGRLRQEQRELHDQIARRAYEIFCRRGPLHLPRTRGMNEQEVQRFK